MRVGEIVIAAGVKRAVSINMLDYLEDDVVSGSPSWDAANGMTIEGSPTFADNVATAIVKPTQTGCDYVATCSVELEGGGTEDFTILVRCRDTDEDPRLTR